MLKMIKKALRAADSIVDDIADVADEAHDTFEKIGETVKNGFECLSDAPEINDVTEAENDTVIPPIDDKNDNEDEIHNSLRTDAESTIEALMQEIASLKSEIARLEQIKKAESRILAEIGDFTALFPDVPVEEVPDEVWDRVKGGASLAASYALYEKKMAADAKRVAQINEKNASRSPGAAGVNTGSEYFSPDDVRRMSRSEVHANYSKIKESMKKWMRK
nr:MAG TPA: hypothetical protein [Bacteriophage sp.]